MITGCLYSVEVNQLDRNGTSSFTHWDSETVFIGVRDSEMEVKGAYCIALRKGQGTDEERKAKFLPVQTANSVPL